MSIIIEAEHPYSYEDDDGTEISFKQGERFILINKANADWWKVQRTGLFTGKTVCYVPAAYVKEVNTAPCGEKQNLHVNLDVYKKIITKDFDGLSKLNNKSMVVLKGELEKNDCQSGDLECRVNRSKDLKDETMENRQVDDIPKDVIQFRLNSSYDSDESPPPTSPLSFEISPRSDHMKSFTLPTGQKKDPGISLGRSVYLSDKGNKQSWKQRSNISHSSQSAGQLKMAEAPGILPKGWLIDTEEITNDIVYVNSDTKERWKSCLDKNGYTYYYNIDGNGTSWDLPELTSRTKVPVRRKSFDEQEGIMRRKLGSELTNRSSKCQSVIMLSPSSLPPDDEKKTLMNATVPDREGLLHRRRVVEGGKPVKKQLWQQYYCYKFGSTMVFYKDQRAPSSKPGLSGKPESSLDLHGAKLDHVSKDKARGKKNVFQITTYGGYAVQQFIADNEVDMGQWLTLIQTTIKHLEDEEPLPQVVDEVDLDSEKPLPYSQLSPISAGGQPTSPILPKHLNTGEKERGLKGFSRRFSKKITQSSASINAPSDEEQKMKIKNKLKKYLNRRPSFTELEDKGIIKDYVFGCALSKVCDREESLVPKFIAQIIAEVEHRGLQTEGLYRVPGNLSLINKLRVMVDHGELIDFKQDQWSDIHLLAGLLKLYFRELPEPVIPFNMYDRFINITKSPFQMEKLNLAIDALKALPAENKETLSFLITHLNRVIAHSSENRMRAQNLAIVFGPTLLWPKVNDAGNVAMVTVYQAQLIEFLILECAKLFPRV